MKLLSALAAGLLSAAGLASAQDLASSAISRGPFPKDLNGSNFTYPYPVNVFTFRSQQQTLQMAFMDVKPTCSPNGQTAVVLHGKNFCGPTWNATIVALANAGYRVIAPDQVGWCKSSKPDNYQFSLNQLAMNTRGLLDALGIGSITLIGHSVGGMLSTRFALQYPSAVDRLVLVDPVGLEDYVEKGVPYVSLDDDIAAEAAQTFASIKAYEQQIYYVGQWDDSYTTWVTMLTNVYFGSKRNQFIKNQGQIVDMVLTSPVAHYFGDIVTKTLLIVGDKDKVAIGANWSPPEVAAKLGHFDVLGPQVCGQIPDCTLYQFPTLGHAPQISAPSNFTQVVLSWLST
ncbi:Epoxide hydrolase [Trichoderma cornu-damae]|uniref:Epoxide hydrolase n=1 Tax=Trichoderma cornu-damae TaxID=654480 RepID=A0A9P8QU41_9HYPO|nr:Epoxide hydrolase [Trichoderma cornu-damae]